MGMKLTSFLLCLLLNATGPTSAPLTDNTRTLAEGAERPAARIEQVAWLQGSWTGEGLGGEVEETWSAPAAGTMIGSFRMIQDGEVRFYETFIIREEEGTLVLRLKHFNADLTGWEEKGEVVTFPLVEFGQQEVYFDGLTYRRTDAGLESYVVAKKPDGSRSEFAFRYPAGD